MILLAASLYLALFALAAGMQRHAPALLGPPAGALAPYARPAGWVLLALSLLAAVRAPDWSFALLTWFGLVPALGGVVVLGLTYGAWLPRAAAVIALAVGIISAL